ncbi:MAG TPA: carboxymuconolactone decarboxylase family protein [Nitriliruptoraceae bacterium]|nr:carboxymuconolactone decarboxylase family protein [Nitriliruptoraceae bacterium]
MPRLPARDRAGLPEYEDLFTSIESHLGVLPNSTLTMAHRPPIMAAFANLNEAVMGPGTVDQQLKQLVALMVSSAATCRYCQAHTAHVAHERGVADEKIEALFEYETSDLFNDAERAAIAIAEGAGHVPNRVTDEQFATLREHFSDEQAVELVAVMAVFGYLNRWNDTMATALESSPLDFASDHLQVDGWTVGKHA